MGVGGSSLLRPVPRHDGCQGARALPAGSAGVRPATGPKDPAPLMWLFQRNDLRRPDQGGETTCRPRRSAYAKIRWTVVPPRKSIQPIRGTSALTCLPESVGSHGCLSRAAGLGCAMLSISAIFVLSSQRRGSGAAISRRLDPPCSSFSSLSFEYVSSSPSFLGPVGQDSHIQGFPHVLDSVSAFRFYLYRDAFSGPGRHEVHSLPSADLQFIVDGLSTASVVLSDPLPPILMLEAGVLRERR